MVTQKPFWNTPYQNRRPCCFDATILAIDTLVYNKQILYYFIARNNNYSMQFKHVPHKFNSFIWQTLFVKIQTSSCRQKFPSSHQFIIVKTISKNASTAFWVRPSLTSNRSYLMTGQPIKPEIFLRNILTPVCKIFTKKTWELQSLWTREYPYVAPT